MAILVRYQCYGCGAPCETRGAAWARCGHCRALLGFDFQAYLESTEYKQWLSKSASLVERWAPYQELDSEATMLGLQGRLDEAYSKERAAQQLLLELTPHLFPPEVHQDPSYRERYLWMNAWFTVQQKVEPVARQLNNQMMDLLRQIDYRDPMKVVRPAAESLDQMMRHLESLPGRPEDPDGMPSRLRVRIWSGQFLSGYLHLLSQSDRLEVLRTIHGRENVIEVGEGPDDEGGMFKDWLCAKCGLFSPQHRSASENTCPGCMFRMSAAPPAAELAAEQVRCPTCGAPIDVAAGALEGDCPFCRIPVHRAARTGAADRAFQQEIMARYGAPTLPPEGQEGFHVTPENREEMVLKGLARMASWYCALLPQERFVRLVRKTFAALSDSQRAGKLVDLEKQADQPSGEPLTPDALKLIRAIRDELGDPARASLVG
jgi:hypothetical protein